MPIGVVGLLFKHAIENELRGLYVIAAAAVVFAIVLALAEWVHLLRVRSRKPLKDLAAVGWGETLLVGVAQCFALIPGASRSGTTITGGIFGGMTREAAARFSFLLSLPSVFAAGLYELYKEKDKLQEQGFLNLVIATVVAGLVGYASIAFLIRFLKTHSTWVFIGYRVAAGVLLAVLVWRGVLPNQPPEQEGRAGQKFADFARTFPAMERLSLVGAETVSASPVFLKSPGTNVEENRISSREEIRPAEKVRQDVTRKPNTLTDHCLLAGLSWPARPFLLDRRRSVMAVFTLRTLAPRGVSVVARRSERQPAPRRGVPAGRPDPGGPHQPATPVAQPGAELCARRTARRPCGI